MSNTPEEIGQLIKRLRKERGLTQTELGAKMGIKKSNVAFYEHGRNAVSLDALVRFADALDAELVIDIKLK